MIATSDLPVKRGKQRPFLSWISLLCLQILQETWMAALPVNAGASGTEFLSFMPTSRQKSSLRISLLLISLMSWFMRLQNNHRAKNEARPSKSSLYKLEKHRVDGEWMNGWKDEWMVSKTETTTNQLLMNLAYLANWCITDFSSTESLHTHKRFTHTHIARI